MAVSNYVKYLGGTGEEDVKLKKKTPKTRGVLAPDACPLSSWSFLGWLLLPGCVVTILFVFYSQDFNGQLSTMHDTHFVLEDSVKQLPELHYAKRQPGKNHVLSEKGNFTDYCNGRLIYVYNISEEYNRAFVRACATFKKGRDLCMYMDSGGMGRRFQFGALQGGPSGGSERAWYNTWQFALELYFHERLLKHPCLTGNGELANAFYVPYYAGMDLSHIFTHRLVKDKLYMELGKWLQGQKSWKKHKGRNHFIVLGRIESDFRRRSDDLHMWGNEMLLRSPYQEMVKLTIESATKNRKRVENAVAIPYPTYFHASSDGEVQTLIDWVSQTVQRKCLVTMAAGKRRPSGNGMRHRLMNQCSDDPRCTLLLCTGHEASTGLSEEIRNSTSKLKLNGKTLNVFCNNPAVILHAMHQSKFCLQPPGDSPTRRSFFDAMLAGCIPVIFSKEAAWSQYVHHLPENGASYSVLIPMQLAAGRNVIDILSNILPSEVKRMQSNIAKLLPRLLYANVDGVYQQLSKTLNSSGPSIATPDAFDIALDAVLWKINSSYQRAHNIEHVHLQEK